MPRADPGPACMTCREKCRKCDRARPRCQRCISKGLVCRGYPDQFRFCGIASRGKWKNARIPAVDKDVPGPDENQTTSEMSSSPIEGEVSKRLAIDSMLVKPVDDLTALLESVQTKTLLHHYDTFISPHQLAEIGDEEDNPYRAYILPLAKRRIALLYAVLGFSAVHLGKLTNDQPMHETAAVEYRMKAIRALGELISRSQASTLSEEEQDTIFATIQMLLLHDIAETGISEHGAHITGAMSVCKSVLHAEGFHEGRRRAVFFIGNLSWLDIIRAFAGTRRLCFTQDIREMVASASGDRFELVNGCPREIFLIIGRALDKAKEYKHGWTSEEDFQSTLLLANRELYSWDPRTKTYPSPDPRWQDVAVAFQYACILHIHRLLDPSQPARSLEIQAAVQKILDSTAMIPTDSSLIELMIMPLFLAGADSLSPHSQYYVLSRLRDIEGRSEVRNQVPATLLRQVWAVRAAQPGQENISWREFTCSPRLTRQHDYLII
ncbi:fungal-specific transcription factor domain-containing protein [Aspergillus unguis]